MAKAAKQAKKRKKPILYVTGGKTGAQFINEIIFSSLPFLLEKYLLIHQTGGLDFLKAKEAKDKLAPGQKKDYWPIDFLSAKEVGWALNNSRLVVSRAGAHIVWELIVVKKPALLIPIPWTYQDEQRKNALFFSSLGLGLFLDQETTTKEVFLKTMAKMEKEIDKYLKKGEKVEN